MVTHDSKVAAKAHRTIRLLDGRIESDTVNRQEGSS
jgi:predicted ABC-type transport system involved in lysophospholipase L1 biosynthesis ATPase subunit